MYYPSPPHPALYNIILMYYRWKSWGRSYLLTRLKSRWISWTRRNWDCSPALKGFIADLHGGGGVVLKQLNYTISMLSILFRSVDRIVKIIKMIHVGVKKSSRTFWIFSGNISSPNSQDILPGPLKSTNIYYFGYFIYMCLNKVSKKSLFWFFFQINKNITSGQKILRNGKKNIVFTLIKTFFRKNIKKK